MHTVDILDEAFRLAERVGFSVRRQWLADGLGGACRIGEQRVLFVNLSATIEEQLQQVIGALRREELADVTEISEPLSRLLK